MGEVREAGGERKREAEVLGRRESRLRKAKRQFLSFFDALEYLQVQKQEPNVDILKF